MIEALLRAIANANEGATYATAAVKRIETLQIGKDAVGIGGRVKRPFSGEGRWAAPGPGGMPPSGPPPFFF